MIALVYGHALEADNFVPKKPHFSRPGGDSLCEKPGGWKLSVAPNHERHNVNLRIGNLARNRTKITKPKGAKRYQTRHLSWYLLDPSNGLDDEIWWLLTYGCLQSHRNTSEPNTAFGPRLCLQGNFSFYSFCICHLKLLPYTSYSSWNDVKARRSMSLGALELPRLISIDGGVRNKGVLNVYVDIDVHWYPLDCHWNCAVQESCSGECIALSLWTLEWRQVQSKPRLIMKGRNRTKLLLTIACCSTCK